MDTKTDQCLARRDGLQCQQESKHTGDHQYPIVGAMEGRWREVWPRFEEALKTKLDHGYRTYGDKSFDMPLNKLLYELKQEAVDLAGWGLVVFAAIERMERKL